MVARAQRGEHQKAPQQGCRGQQDDATWNACAALRIPGTAEACRLQQVAAATFELSYVIVHIQAYKLPIDGRSLAVKAFFSRS